MTKVYILQEIKRTTQANGGKPLRKIKFESETGIKRFDWFGIYWARWSDALREAGCAHNPIPVPARPIFRNRSIMTRSRTMSPPMFNTPSRASH